MARSRFAGTDDDRVEAVWNFGSKSIPTLASSVSILFYDAATDGNQITDLTSDEAGATPTTVTSDADGYIPAFYGPDGVTALWAQAAGSTRRFLMVSTDQAAAANAVAAAQEAQAAAESAAADVAAVEATNDGIMTAVAQDPGSAFSGALSATFGTVAEAIGGNIQATVRKMADDVNDVTILVLGDSTAAQAEQWPYQLMPQVQALYPHRTLRQWVWNTATNTYDGPTTVAAGTGATFINFYQGAESGTVPESVWATMQTQVAVVQPDLVIVNFGHNYGKNAADGGQPNDATMDWVFRERMTRFVAEVKALCSQADVMIASQNPYLTDGARYQISNVRAQAFRAICADLGCAYGPILEAYLATDDPALYIGPDGLHPLTSGTYNGAGLAATALLPFFVYDAKTAPSARVASPFLLPGINLLTNGNFSDFAAPPALPGWTASAVTLSKNATDYESKNGYSVKIAATVQGAVANATLYQLLPIRRVRGQLVTVAARFWIPTGQGSQPGRVSLSGDGFTTITSGTLTNVRDAWVWAFATARIPAAATFATFSILAGAAGPTTTDQCSVDRASAVLGHMPRDLS